ncbi:MAG TPA: TolC family outer membrane protein [Sphingomonas sp.]
MLLPAGGAHATTLREALVATYDGNPTLTGQRASLRAVDEDVALARAAGRPSATATAGVTQGLDGFRTIGTYNRQVTAGVTASVPIFEGGRIRNAIHAGEARVASGRETLRSTEGSVFVDAVSAYMDVLRDRETVRLNLNNLNVLQTNLEATNDRFQAGDLTRTDVAQSQARVQDGQSQVAGARARLVTSEENYRRVTGLAAGMLDQPPPLPPLPDSADKAEDMAIASNPDIAAAAATVKAAHYDVATQRAGRMPTLSGSAGANYYDYVDGGRLQGLPYPNERGTYSTAGVTATLPLYQGGEVAAQVRQAQAFESQAMESETAIERQVVANVRAAFSNYQAALDVITSSQGAVSANTLALEGVRAEQSVGERQVLDVLNAEQELLNSEVSLVGARHDAYVAGFDLLNAMGLVNYRHLGLEGGALYDPQVHYRHSTRALGDSAEDARPAPVAKPTGYGPIAVPIAPVQNPLVTAPGN